MSEQGNKNMEQEKIDNDEVKENSEELKENEVENEEVDVNEILIQKENEAKSYLDRLQRTMAEFDNFRKRTTKEKSMMYESGAKEVLEAILPIIDNFERALDSCDEETKKQPFSQGIEMIYKQFKSVLEDLDVKKIEAVGKAFDPNYHNAVTHVEDENYGENEVIEEFQKGYMYKDTVIRYSMVKVAN